VKENKTARTSEGGTRNSRVAFALLLILSISFPSFGQLPTNNLVPASVAVVSGTNGALMAPANFFAANSNLLNASVSAVALQSPWLANENVAGFALTNANYIQGTNYASLTNAAGTNIIGSTGQTNTVGGAIVYSQAAGIVSASAFAGNGANLTNLNLFPAITWPAYVIIDGDSLTSGTAGIGTVGSPGMTWARWLMQVFFAGNTNIIGYTNAAIAGETFATMDANYSSVIHPLITNGVHTLLFIWGGINDISGGSSGATVITHAASYYAKAKADNTTVVGFTITDETTFNAGGEIKRDEVSQYVKTNGIIDYVVDAQNLFPLAVGNGGIANTVDGVHLTTNNQYLLAQAAYKTIQSRPQSQCYSQYNDGVFSSLKVITGWAFDGGTTETYLGQKLGGYILGDTPSWFLEDAGNVTVACLAQGSANLSLYQRRGSGNIAAADLVWQTGFIWTNGIQYQGPQSRLNTNFDNVENAMTMTVTNNLTILGAIIGGCIMTSNNAVTNVTFNSSGQWQTVYECSGPPQAAVTINLPTTTTVGQVLRYVTKAQATAATTTGGTLDAGATVTTLSANSSVAFEADSATGHFVRIQ
jgi:hypothetical protein